MVSDVVCKMVFFWHWWLIGAVQGTFFKKTNFAWSMHGFHQSFSHRVWEHSLVSLLQVFANCGLVLEYLGFQMWFQAAHPCLLRMKILDVIAPLFFTGKHPEIFLTLWMKAVIRFQVSLNMFPAYTSVFLAYQTEVMRTSMQFCSQARRYPIDQSNKGTWRCRSLRGNSASLVDMARPHMFCP